MQKSQFRIYNPSLVYSDSQSFFIHDKNDINDFSKEVYFEWNLMHDVLYFSQNSNNHNLIESENESSNIIKLYDYFRLIHPDDREMVIQLFAEMRLHKKDYYKLEYRIQYPDSNYYYIRLRSKVLKHENGFNIHILGIQEDIDGEKQIEGKFNQILHELPNALMITNGLDILFVNDFFQNLTGFSAEYLNELDVFDLKKLFTDEATARLREKNEDFFEAVSQQNTSIQFTDFYGNQFQLKIKGHHGIFKNMPCFYVYLDDVTELMDKHQSLFAMQKMVDEVNVPIVWLNDVFEVIYKNNEAHSKQIEFLSEAIKNDILSHFDCSNFKELLVKNIINKNVLAVNASNAQFLASFQIIKVNEIAFMVLQLMDETQPKVIDEILQHKNDELTKLNHELDRVIFSIAHDLRAPIASVLGLINLSKHEEDLQQMRTMNDMKEKSLKKLDNYIRDILIFSRNHREPVQFSEVNVSETIDEVIANLKWMDHYERAVFIKENLNLVIVTDKKRLYVIFEILIGNALHFSLPALRQPKIEIEIKKTPQDFVLIVADNAEGIEDEKMPKIFDMFYRGSQRSNGSGLGLYILKETLAKLRGRVEVSSIPGQGSVFTVYLPT